MLGLLIVADGSRRTVAGRFLARPFVASTSAPPRVVGIWGGVAAAAALLGIVEHSYAAGVAAAQGERPAVTAGARAVLTVRKRARWEAALNSAGYPALLLVRDGRDWLLSQGGGLPLGVGLGDLPAREVRSTLRPGDRLLFYGTTEARSRTAAHPPARARPAGGAIRRGCRRRSPRPATGADASPENRVNRSHPRRPANPARPASPRRLRRP